MSVVTRPSLKTGDVVKSDVPLCCLRCDSLAPPAHVVKYLRTYVHVAFSASDTEGGKERGKR